MHKHRKINHKEQCVIVADNQIDLQFILNEPSDNIYFIGVEKGCLALIEKNLPLHFAIGDFDSVSFAEKNVIFKHATRYQIKAKNSDLFDGELAIQHAIHHHYCDVLFLCYSQKIEMDLITMYLIYKYKIKFKNQTSFAYSLKPHTNNLLQAMPDYHYISFLPLSRAVISLKNFKWTKENLKLDVLSPIASHNEFVNHNSGEIEVKNGHVIAIYSKK